MAKREVARETPTAKPMDNLALDAMDAKAAGMSYGQWKALHPHTKEANAARLAANAQSTPGKVYEFICRGCGEKFTTKNAKLRYCGDGGKAKRDAAKYRARQAQKAPAEN